LCKNTKTIIRLRLSFSELFLNKCAKKYCIVYINWISYRMNVNTVKLTLSRPVHTCNFLLQFLIWFNSLSDEYEQVDELWMFIWGIEGTYTQNFNSSFTCIRRILKSHLKSQQKLQVLRWPNWSYTRFINILNCNMAPQKKISHLIHWHLDHLKKNKPSFIDT
jgi:hypothetical protein